MLDERGNLTNLQLAAEGERSGYQGIPGIADSDVFKVLEACYWASLQGTLSSGSGDDVARNVSQTVEVIVQAQQPDGYLNSWYQVTGGDDELGRLSGGTDLYCAGHLLQAGVAELRSTENDILFRVARRQADQLWAELGPSGRPVFPVHAGLEMALVELFRCTGDQRYLDLAVSFLDRRGYGTATRAEFGLTWCQDHVPLREATRLEGHAVMAAYLGAGATDIAVETNDRGLLEHLEALWARMVAENMYITGGFGSRHRDESLGAAYELPPDRAYSETCASIGATGWAWRLLLATGKSRYADYIERALYNVIGGGVGLTGESFFYVNSLHARRRSKNVVEPYPPLQRQTWFYCACCPPNLMRTFACLPSFVASTTATGVQLHQYVSGEVDSGSLRLSCSSDAPFGGNLLLTITEAAPGETSIGVRVPSWSPTVAATVNGQPHRTEVDAQGYLALRGTWAPGDEIAVHFDGTPRFVAPSPEVDAVQGTVAVTRGPLVYCTESLGDEDLGHVAVTRDSTVDLAEGSDTKTLILDGIVEVLDSSEAHDEVVGPYHPIGTPASACSIAQVVPGSAHQLVLIPYYLRANANATGMRVWLPVHQPSSVEGE
jgi:uncharacterized protein